MMQVIYKKTLVSIVLSVVLTTSSTSANAQSSSVWLDKEVAVLQGLDKITAKIRRFTAPVGQPVTFGRVSVLVQACRRTPPEEKPESAAFLEIDDRTVDEGTQRVFTGWMFASTPALSALEHPVYDINVIECRNDEQ